MLEFIPHEGQAFLDDKEVKKSLSVAYVEQKSISATISYQGQECVSLDYHLSRFSHFKGQPLEKSGRGSWNVGLSDYADRLNQSQLSGGPIPTYVDCPALPCAGSWLHLLDEPL